MSFKHPQVPTVVWFGLVAQLIIASVYQVEWWAILVIIGYFGVWEYIALRNDIPGDTFTEFQRHRVQSRIFRWLLGLWVVVIILVRVPQPWASWIAVPFTIWYPIHLAVPGVERRAWEKLKGLYRRLFKRGK